MTDVTELHCKKNIMLLQLEADMEQTKDIKSYLFNDITLNVVVADFSLLAANILKLNQHIVDIIANDTGRVRPSVIISNANTN